MTVDFASKCPFCGTANEAATAVRGDATPTPGDFSLCFGCGEWAVFDPLMRGGQRRPTHAEYIEIVNDKVATAARSAWLETKGGLDR